MKHRTMIRIIATFVSLFSFLWMSVFLSSCERIQHAIPPDDLQTTIKIGFIYSPPDPGTTRNGAEVAVTLANEAGGINGLAIELLIRDDEGDASLSVHHANALIAEGVLAIVGPDYSAIAMAIAPTVEQHGIPMITTYPTNPKVPEGSYYTFMGAYTDPYQGRVMANFAIETLEAMSAAVLTEAGSTYSEGLSNAFIEDFREQGGTIGIEAHQYYNTGETDFTDQLTEIAAIEPAVDVVFLAGLGLEFPLAVKQAKSTDFNISATFLGGDGWDRPDLVQIGGVAVEGSFFANHFSSGGQLSERGSQFVTAYTEQFGIPPDGPAALGYDAATIVFEAMRRAIDLTPASIRDAIERTQHYNGAAMLSHFNENRHAIKNSVINTIKDGKIQFYQFITP